MMIQYVFIIEAAEGLLTFTRGLPASLMCMFLAVFSPRLVEFDGVIVCFTSGFFVKAVPSALKNAVSNYQGRIKMKRIRTILQLKFI